MKTFLIKYLDETDTPMEEEEVNESSAIMAEIYFEERNPDCEIIETIELEDDSADDNRKDLEDDFRLNHTE